MTNAAGPPCANSASGGPQNTRVASPFSSYSAQDSARQAMAEELGTAAGSAGTASSSGGRVAVAETSHDAQLARQVHEDEVVALMQTHSGD